MSARYDDDYAAAIDRVGIAKSPEDAAAAVRDAIYLIRRLTTQEKDKAMASLLVTCAVHGHCELVKDVIDAFRQELGELTLSKMVVKFEMGSKYRAAPPLGSEEFTLIEWFQSGVAVKNTIGNLKKTYAILRDAGVLSGDLLRPLERLYQKELEPRAEEPEGPEKPEETNAELIEADTSDEEV